MNENTQMAEAHELLGLVEILDENGNPTGEYKPREGEAASEEATVFVAEDAASHEVH